MPSLCIPTAMLRRSQPTLFRKGLGRWRNWICRRWNRICRTRNRVGGRARNCIGRRPGNRICPRGSRWRLGAQTGANEYNQHRNQHFGFNLHSMSSSNKDTLEEPALPRVVRRERQFANALVPRHLRAGPTGGCSLFPARRAVMSWLQCAAAPRRRTANCRALSRANAGTATAVNGPRAARYRVSHTV